MPPQSDTETLNELADRIERLERRLDRIEEHLGLVHSSTEPRDGSDTAVIQQPEEGAGAKEQDEFEFEVGQNVFAKIGIVVLALGIAFLLTLEYPNLPPAAPGIFGYVLAGGLFLLTRLLQKSFDLVSRYLRGAGMALLFFTSLRLCFFVPEPVLNASSATGMALLLAVFSINAVIALRRKSSYLFGLVLTTGFATSVAVASTWFVLGFVTLLCLITAYAGVRFEWKWISFYCVVLTYPIYLIWALGNPILGNSVGFMSSPHLSVFFILGYVIVIASGTLLRRDHGPEKLPVIATSFANGGACYLVFFLHTTGAFGTTVVIDHLLASLILLGLAITFWVREKSLYSTFAYAMLGYLALSVSVIKLFDVPGVFVWLSVQSILVVATAVWFRSRFIVVANFFIYLLIVAAYVILTKEESGISLGFGVVALVTARILSWKQDRLALKTEKMRNAYLASAFVVFPYAMYHLVPHAYVSLSWVGIAGFYYTMNLVIRKQKYRWMGHSTLILTVLYVLIIGIGQLEPTYRIVSFLVLGTVLLVVSLVFTRIRNRSKSAKSREPV